MQLLNSQDMKRLDAYMISKNHIPAAVLMENAAQGVLEACIKAMPNQHSVFDIICGIGNNGGDGFAVARKLLTHGFNVCVYLVGDSDQLKGDALVNAQYFIDTNTLVVLTKTNITKALVLHPNDIIVDALFGIGLSRDISGVHALVVGTINQAKVPVVSVDIPSGINADTGQVMGSAINATYTVTFEHAKLGHFLQPGKAHCGNMTVYPIGLTNGFCYPTPPITVYSKAHHPVVLPKRAANAHKGTYGNLGLVCTSTNMVGAGIFAANAAIKSGTGLLNLYVDEAVKNIFAAQLPQAITQTMQSFLQHEQNLTALAIGPGLSTSLLAKQLVTYALSTYPNLTKVLDADALNIIAENMDLLKDATGELILTPHPKEFARLTGLSVQTILKNPVAHAITFAIKHQLTLVLKLATSVVVSKTGQVALIAAGTPGMAKGGSGDVLTGIIGAFVAQKFSVFDAAVTGAYIAGIAGEMADEVYGEYAMTALDTIDKIALAINHCK